MIPDRRAVGVTPAVCKASAGAVEHLAVARVRNLADWLESAKERAGLWVYGAAAEAAEPYTSVDLKGPVVLVMGSEGSGLRPRVEAMCDALVSIPLRGRAASLNVSAAAAILLFEAVRQTRCVKTPPDGLRFLQRNVHSKVGVDRTTLTCLDLHASKGELKVETQTADRDLR